MLDIQTSDITPRYAFSIGDRVSFACKTWNVFERLENGFAFRPGNGEGPVQEFTNTQLAQFVRAGDLSHSPYRKPATEDFGNDEQIADFLASRTDAHHGTARGREALILAFDSLHEEGRVKCTYLSVDENIDTIMGRAAKINKMSTANNPNLPSTLSGKTLFRWRAKYRKYGLISLYDGSPRKGNRDPKLVPEVLKIITPIIERYAEPFPPTKKQIYEDVEIAIKDANRERPVSSSDWLETPSQTTINTRIKLLDPFLVCLAHHGEAVAKRRFSSTRFGVQASGRLHVGFQGMKRARKKSCAHAFYFSPADPLIRCVGCTPSRTVKVRLCGAQWGLTLERNSAGSIMARARRRAIRSSRVAYCGKFKDCCLGVLRCEICCGAQQRIEQLGTFRGSGLELPRNM